MRERNVVLVPTLARLQSRIDAAKAQGVAPDVLERLEANRKRTLANTRIRLDVPVVFGTDATVLPHGQNVAEFSALVEAGLTPREAIGSATTRAAQLLGSRMPVASHADLLAVNGDPLSDVATLREPILVVAREGDPYAC